MDYTNTCRICLRSDGGLKNQLINSLRPKHNVNSKSAQRLYNMLYEILEINEPRRHGFDKICLHCSTELHKIYSIITKCEKSTTMINSLKEFSIRLKQIKFFDLDVLAGNNEEIAELENVEVKQEMEEMEVEKYDDLNTENCNAIDVYQIVDEFEDNEEYEETLEKHLEDDQQIQEEWHENEANSSEPKDIELALDGRAFPETDSPSSTNPIYFQVLKSRDEISIVYKCKYEQCSQEFLTGRSVRRHLQLVHDEDQFYFCSHCNQKFVHLEQLARHERAIHNVSTFVCDKCGIFFEESQLAEHMKIHVNETLLACNQCDAKFANQMLLLCHIREHSGARFNCDRCDAKFTILSDMRQHKLQHLLCEAVCS